MLFRVHCNMYYCFFFYVFGLLSCLGKGGQKIREIQEQSGAYIKVCATEKDHGLRVEMCC